MAGNHADISKSLARELGGMLARVFEGMGGARPEVTVADAGSSPSAGAAVSQHLLNGLAQGGLWIAVTEAARSSIGSRILTSAGVDDADASTIESTFVETITQAVSTLASSLTRQLEREITPAAVIPGIAPASTHWNAIELSWGDNPGEGRIVLEAAFDESLTLLLAPRNEVATVAGSAAPAFDLLLDVELPVTVSFGRAQIALKDAIKLTTGSIIELNRSIAEPVELIVNNCVVARGDVVVLDGYFGVRIQQVVSRLERLRTLQ